MDDGSIDLTASNHNFNFRCFLIFFAEVAISYSSDYPLFVLQLPQNIGKGGAVREGVLCARGQFILFADADGATTFADIEKLEQRMKVLFIYLDLYSYLL